MCKQYPDKTFSWWIEVFVQASAICHSFETALQWLFVTLKAEEPLKDVVELLVDAPLVGSQASPGQQRGQDRADPFLTGSVVGETQDFRDGQFANLQFRLVERREFLQGDMDPGRKSRGTPSACRVWS